MTRSFTLSVLLLFTGFFTIHAQDPELHEDRDTLIKNQFPGSVIKLYSEDLQRISSSEVTKQLSGKLAGMLIHDVGNVTDDSRIRIHGFGSFQDGSPLIIIDGVPGGIEDMNAYDIESIQVLKDAGSASIFGARAANGVMVISTKKGVTGPVKVSFDSYFGFGFLPKSRFPDLLDAKELGDLIWRSYENAGLSPVHPQYGSSPNPVIPEYILVNDHGFKYGGASLEAMKSSSDPSEMAFYQSLINPENYDLPTHQIVKSGNTDWFDEVYNAASLKNVQMTATGGAKSFSYLTSFNYSDQGSISDAYSFHRRYSLRANTAYKIKSMITLGENLQFAYHKGRDAGMPGAAWTMPALLPVHDIAGNFASSAAPGICGTSDAGMGNNPLATAWHNRSDLFTTYGVTGNAFADINLYKNLSWCSFIGLHLNDYSFSGITERTFEHAENNVPPPGYSMEFIKNQNTWILNSTLTYKTALHPDHRILFLLGFEELWKHLDEKLTIWTSISGLMTKSAFKSYFGQVKYAYRNKFLFATTVRKDFSSLLSEKKKNTYFPAFSVAWRIKEENFIQKAEWINDFKIRASFGYTGSYPDIPQVIGNSQPGYFFSASRFERVRNINAGLDLVLFDNSLTAIVDFYEDKGTDIVAFYPDYFSFPVIYTYLNSAIIRNTGMDASIIKQGKLPGEVTYRIGINFSKYRNEVLKVFENTSSAISDGATRMGPATINRAGEEISSYYGWKLDGFIDTETELDEYSGSVSGGTWLAPRIGGWKIKDISGPEGMPDGRINDFDRTILGSPHPDFQLGFNLDLTWKSFDFSALLLWSKGGEIFNYSRYYVDFNTFSYQRSERMLKESWTPQNHSAVLPELNINDVSSDRYITDYFIEDASYVRLRNLNIGYRLPDALVKMARIASLRIYLQVQNSFLWTRFSGLDPDVAFSGSETGMGVANNYTPVATQFIFGINMNIL